MAATDKRELAVYAFGVFGGDARSAIPELARMFANAAPSNRFEIGECLWRILPSKNLDPNHDTPDRVYELRRDDLLAALGAPTVLHDDWAAYNIGDAGILPGPARFYLCIAFSHDRIVDSIIVGSGSTNIPSPFERPGNLFR